MWNVKTIIDINQENSIIIFVQIRKVKSEVQF